MGKQSCTNDSPGHGRIYPAPLLLLSSNSHRVDVVEDTANRSFSPDPIQQLLTRLAIQNSYSCLEALPVEIQLMVLGALEDLKDLISLTDASLCYHSIAEWYNQYTELTFKQLKNQNIHLLPRDITMPLNCRVAETNFRVRKGVASRITQARDALEAFLFQHYRNRNPIRLTIQHCMAIQGIEEVYSWRFQYHGNVEPIVNDRPCAGERYIKFFHESARVYPCRSTSEVTTIYVTQRFGTMLFSPSDKTIAYYRAAGVPGDTFITKW